MYYLREKEGKYIPNLF